MNKSKAVGITVGLLFLVAGIVVGVLLVFRNQDIREKAAPASSLSITPSSQSKSAGSTFNLAVQMDTGSNKSVGFDIVLEYNSQAVEIVSISKGSAISNFQEIRNNIDNINGKLAYSAYNADSTKAIQGTSLNILNISAKVKPTALAGNYTFKFGSTTAAAGLTEGQNILIASSPATLTVSSAQTNSNATPTPTPIATPVKTPSPTPTSQNTNASSTPTPVPTATVAPTLSPTQAPVTTGATATPRPLPVTGISLPTVVFIVIGFGALLLNLFLAL